MDLLTATETSIPDFSPEQFDKAQAIILKHAAMRITDNEPCDNRPPLIVMHDKTIATRQNLIAISGPSKGGKTAITSLLCAGSISGIATYDGCPAIKIAPNTTMQAVLHFDTEQCRAQHYTNFKLAVVKRAGVQLAPSYFYSHNLLEKNPKECKAIVAELFEAAFVLHKGIHLAVIDGVADFMRSVNDEEEANEIVAFFRRLAIKYNTVIVLVVHHNPGTEKERGHLGSQLQRKCESVLTITKNEKLDLSFLTAKYLRQGNAADFAKIAYRFNAQKGYHVFTGAETQDPKHVDLTKLARQVFIEPLRHKDAVLRIEEVEKCKTSNAKRKLNEMQKYKIVEKRKEESTTLYTLVTQVAA